MTLASKTGSSRRAPNIDDELAALLDGERWEAAARLLERHPETQNREAGERIGRVRLPRKKRARSKWLSKDEQDFIAWMDDTAPDVMGPLFASLFERCAQIGVDAAFEESGRGWRKHPLIARRQELEISHLGDDYIEELHGHDLSAAVTDWQKLVAHADFPGAPVAFRLQIWRELGQMLSSRVKEDGGEEMARTAVDCRQSVVDHAEAGDPDSGADLANLASALAVLGALTGRMEELERAIDIGREALAEAGEDEAPAVAASLGTQLLRRFDANRNRADLDEAIELLEDADGRDFMGDSTSLGIALADRYGLTGDLSDLQRSTEFLEEALRFSKSADAYNNLAANFGQLWDSTADERHLRKAMEYAEKALDLTDPDAPELPGRLVNLTEMLRRLHDVRRLKRALARCREVSRRMVHPDTLLTISLWGQWAATRGRWAEAVEAYQLGAARMRTLVKDQSLLVHKRRWLRAAQGLSRGGAYALAKCGRPAEAAEMIEEGRAVLAGEQLRSRLNELDLLARAGDGELARRYRAAALRLRELRLRELRPQKSSALTQRLARDLRDAERQLESVVQSIGPAASEPLSAPVVYVTAAWRGGVALIVDGAARVRRVWLPELTDSRLESRLQQYLAAYGSRAISPLRWRKAIDSMTAWLWDAAMHPVLQQLRGRSRIILIGAGSLGLLPLHAAWTADRSLPTRRRYALDELLITAAPSAAFVRVAERLGSSVGPRSIAVVADRKVAGAALEARAAAAGFEESVVIRDGRREEVRTALAKSDVWHFACHGYAAAEPLESAVLPRRTQPFTVLDFLSLPAETQHRLAVLSACETAVIDGEAPDEAVSLSSALLQTGVAGVIGSLWAVPGDAATPLLMSRFYELWREEKLEPAEALRQAQGWLRDSTNAEKQERFPRIAALGLSGGARSRSHASPYYWGAFTYQGA